MWRECFRLKALLEGVGLVLKQELLIKKPIDYRVRIEYN